MTHASCDAVELSAVDNHGMSSNTLENNIVKKPHGEYGCQFIGSIKVGKVSGKVLLQHIGRPNLFNMMDFLTMNSSHNIRYFRIGTWFRTMIMLGCTSTVSRQYPPSIFISTGQLYHRINIQSLNMQQRPKQGWTDSPFSRHCTRI